ncbi:phosphotransferase family protein [Antarcticimicrobium sediminis]|uniref:Aminoglycoside phosphotransferase family protein n=1 Tax=Antarcticimicrobium sediminis TaxID=2546227 RepID=A0A4R5EQS9_9RHOB|nr:aminoglycoside phosphotransferase family protein [Antarcticimicrobium sediminis]TDE37054.1 aminoglycoside phosphotransferase family protein [Antarcticimicrobium sediminis]
MLPPPELIALLHRRGFVAADPRPVPLAGGHTNRVWRLRGQLYDLVLKLYVSDAATPLFANDPRRETACLAALSGSGIAPTPVAADPQAQTPWILYRHLPGTGWTTGGEAVAELLGRVHAQTAPSGLPNAPDGSAELARQTLEILSLCRSSQTHALRVLEPAGTVAPSGQHRLVHGDPVPGNIVMQGPRATLIDWQCPACGDPAGDLAIFTSPAMQLVYRGAPLSTWEKAAFLGAYPDLATVGRALELQPWYHWRMAAYCLYQSERGRAGYTQGLDLERAALSAQSSAL